MMTEQKGKIECAFEDWDDTALPHPVCHCLKRTDIDCTNVPDDVEACPDFMNKKDKCPECGGKGHINYMNLQEHSPCPTCNGTGEKKLDYINLNPKTPLEQVKEKLDRTKLHEWGSPKGLPRGWRGRIMKSSNEKKLDSPREKIGKAPVLKSYLVPDKTGRPDGHVAFPTLKEQRDADHLYYIALIPDRCANCDTPLLQEVELYQKLEEALTQERERITKDIHSIEFESNSATDFLNKTLDYLKTLKE